MSGSATTSRKPRALAGVLPVFQTPYHADESIDFDTLEREVDWLFAHGADGIVMAMVSEVLRLSSDEREQLAQAACQLAGGRGAVVISVGAESSRLAERFSSHAQAAGADAVMAIPPVSVALSDEELSRYYQRILRACALPVIVQDASGYVGRPMSIELQARLLDEFGDRVMYKPEAAPIGPRLSALLAATDGRARVFEGSGGAALVDSFRRGVVGTMPGADLIDAIAALWRALVAGDDRRVSRLATPIVALTATQTSLDAFLAVEKYLLVKRGVFANAIVRGPVGYTLDPAARGQVDGLFEQVMRALAE
jgi:dihydrodipicolinate synthase/N-acetylneuraminate lyase